MGFADKMKSQEEANKEFAQGSGDWFKFSEGDNRFRVLVEPEMMFEAYKVGICYTGCGYEGSSKFLTYIFDRKDDKVKLAKLPYGVGTTIAGLETDAEWAFTGFPMPYDVNVKAVGAGTKEVKYTVLGSPTRTVISPEKLAELLNKKMMPADVIARMKEKQIEAHKADGTYQRAQEKLAKAKAYADQAMPIIDTIEYPEEDINPDDIPF